MLVYFCDDRGNDDRGNDTDYGEVRTVMLTCLLG